MKTVIFFRHGKSDWDASYGHDHERPVNKRGKKASRRMGKYLAGIGQLPERIITSSATRARMTLELAAEAGGWGDIPTEITDDLYDSSPAVVLSIIQRISDGSESVLLVGHEPTFSETVGHLIGGANVRMGTATMACVEIEAEHWPEVAFGKGRLRWVVGPKVLD